MTRMRDEDFLGSQMANMSWLEGMFRSYELDRKSVDPSWDGFFSEVERGGESVVPVGNKEERILRLKDAYCLYGHLSAHVNPIAIGEVVEVEELNEGRLGFFAEEMDALFPTLGVLEVAEAPLKDIIRVLKERYCGTIGFEYKGFTEANMASWIERHIESGIFSILLLAEEQLVILDALTEAGVLETFLHTKHVGQKRFSLEGGETLIPMLVFLCAKAADDGVQEIFIGMSHRGRLNVLVNLLNKPLRAVFDEFNDAYVPLPEEGMGDARYHKGYANDSVLTYRGKLIKLVVSPNPSHLESVYPVVEGQVHARQFLLGDEEKRDKVIPIVMHGDAALAGQGVVYETLQMSKLRGFETGGTIHIAINNQVGFTASPEEGRSTKYCTDIAKTFGIPVFHVNAEDPHTCVRVILFAFALRQRFHSDVFIDLNCYRKYGHNEGDEAAFTQPLEYQNIRAKKTIRDLYLEELIREKLIRSDEAYEREQKFKEHLQKMYSLSVREEEKERIVQKKSEQSSVPTGVDLNILQKVAGALSQIPTDFHMHIKLIGLVQDRARAVKEDKSIDWGTAEQLAFGTIVYEGIPVRLVGQDSGRGTFSHRHAIWIDQETGRSFVPLAHVCEGQGQFEVFNTCLSEMGALGFEYGYSTMCPDGLTIWEAQFGDFVNGAQVMIDQYITSSEQKWGQASNLVMFLPHGFEGQGPEHSSGRIERFLELASHDNIRIVYPTKPAQLFHLLRLQAKRVQKKPLIVFTPKGLLRHSACVSSVQDLTEGTFFSILDDPKKLKKARHLVLCSGRIYYDLDAEREKRKSTEVAIIRLEQLYPLDVKAIAELIASYGSIQDCRWVQEEPKNMGAWSYMSSYLPLILPADVPFSYVGRDASATPATGFHSRHKSELADILQQVFS